MSRFRNTIAALILWTLALVAVAARLLASYLADPSPAAAIAATVLGVTGLATMQVAVIALGVRVADIRDEE